MVKLCFVCVAFVDAKAVAVIINMYMVSAVQCVMNFKKHTFTCWVKFSKLKTLMTVSI